MRSLQRSVLLALVLPAIMALVACGEDKASDKEPVTLNGEGFTVKMPGEAERTVSTVPSGAGLLSVTTYVSVGGEEGFSVSMSKLPAHARADLASAIGGTASGTGGTAEDSHKTTYQGYKARDARIAGGKDKNGIKGTIFVRVIDTKDRLFQLQFARKGDVKEPPKAYTAFVESLKIR